MLNTFSSHSSKRKKNRCNLFLFIFSTNKIYTLFYDREFRWSQINLILSFFFSNRYFVFDTFLCKPSSHWILTSTHELFFKKNYWTTPKIILNTWTHFQDTVQCQNCVFNIGIAYSLLYYYISLSLSLSFFLYVKQSETFRSILIE